MGSDSEKEEVLRSYFATLGRRGGSVRSEKATRAKRLNTYRMLAKKYPTSVKVRQRLEELERE